MAMFDPPHPGEIIREECLAALGLTVSSGAHALGVTPEALDDLVAERAELTPEMAIRLEKAFGSSADMWLRLQSAFDLANARRRASDIVVDRYVSRASGESRTDGTVAKR